MVYFVQVRCLLGLVRELDARGRKVAEMYMLKSAEEAMQCQAGAPPRVFGGEGGGGVMGVVTRLFEVCLSGRCLTSAAPSRPTPGRAACAFSS